MKIEKKDILIALLVINLGGTFSNAYGLCRVLERKFEIFDCIQVIEKLIDYKLVDFIDINGVKKFSISDKGREVLIRFRQSAIDRLKVKFPKEQEFIDYL